MAVNSISLARLHACLQCTPMAWGAPARVDELTESFQLKTYPHPRSFYCSFSHPASLQAEENSPRWSSASAPPMCESSSCVVPNVARSLACATPDGGGHREGRGARESAGRGAGEQLVLVLVLGM